MADRYTLFEIEKLRDRFALSAGVPAGVKRSYNISPTQTVPVVISGSTGPQMQRMKWGFIPQGAKDANSVFRYKTHIARSEGIFDKPTWQTAIRSTRCLIPANGFYVWKVTPGGKRAFYIHPTDQPLFAFAGIYSTWIDPQGEPWGMCSIITTASDTDTTNLPSRLPVILQPSDEADWLDPTITDINSLYKIMRPYEPDLLQVARVGDAINSTKVDTAQLIAAAS